MKKCLLINSNLSDQAAYMKAIESLTPDMLVALADNSDVAIDLLQRCEFEPDYIIIEYQMPGINAVNFIKKTKKVQTLQNTPVIVHSPTPVSELAEIRGMGVYAWYFKPYSIQGISNMLTILYHNLVHVN